jgi:hypothetical protein
LRSYITIRYRINAIYFPEEPKFMGLCHCAGNGFGCGLSSRYICRTWRLLRPWIRGAFFGAGAGGRGGGIHGRNADHRLAARVGRSQNHRGGRPNQAHCSLLTAHDASTGSLGDTGNSISEHAASLRCCHSADEPYLLKHCQRQPGLAIRNTFVTVGQGIDARKRAEA